MKKLLSILFVIFAYTSFSSITAKNIEIDKLCIKENLSVESVSVETEFQKGFKDGWDEGWKDVKGKYSYPPHPPYPPYPKYPQKSDSYRDGYNTGFKAGRRKAMNS